MFVAACLEVYAGLRSGEALFARWEWIDWEGEGHRASSSTPAYPIKREQGATPRRCSTSCATCCATGAIQARAPPGYIVESD
jgi:hypothetical protein